MKNTTIFAAVLGLSLLVASCCGNNSGAKTAAADQTGCCSAEKTECCNQNDMIKIITAHKFIKPEKVQEFIEFTRPIIEKSRAEEGCISYTLYQDPSDPTKFIFYEEWKGQDAIDFHFSTEHFQLAGSRPDFEAAPTVLTIYDAKKAQ